MLTRRNFLHSAPVACAVPLAFGAASSLSTHSTAFVRNQVEPGRGRAWYFRLDQDGIARETARHEIQPNELVYFQTWSRNRDGSVSVTTEKTIGARLAG